jgi:membrane fusion protein, heavy metal efflux system
VTISTRALRSFGSCVAAILSLLISVSAALAHAGHDHGPQIEVSASVAPRFEAASDDFEVLAVLKAADLIVTLDRFRTNEPITTAKIQATVNGDAAVVTALPDGTYKLVSPLLAKPGRAEIVLTIENDNIADLLAGAIEIPGAAVAATRPTTWWQSLPVTREVMVAALGGLILGVLGVLLVRPRRAHAVARSATVFVVLTALSIASAPSQLAAQTPTKANITITADLPQRLPDGSLFVPKVTQRLLTIRTVMAGESNAGSTIELNGQIIPDPNGFGRIQAPVDGRIDAPTGGLVFVGQKVERGQVLAVLTPVVGTADRSSFEGAVGEIDTRIALAEAKLARITRIAGVVAQKDIDDTRTELETLKTRRNAVRSAIRETITLTAPISGIVSMSPAVPGQLASARDPGRMWVEAIAFDARLVADITAARAIEATGEVLALDFVGRGVSARQQGLPLHFSIKSPPVALVIGKPVTVLLTTKETRQGLILPQSAVVKGQNGLSIVWTHTQAERFKPNVVRVKPIDGQRLLVDGGLAPNERVVIDGATLLNQVR